MAAKTGVVKVTLGVLAVLVVMAAGVAAHDRQNSSATKQTPHVSGTNSATTAKSAPDDIAPALQAAWKTALAGTQAPVDIAVYDHTTGQTAHYSNAPDHVFSTASTMKLSILENILLENQANGIDGLTSTQLPLAQTMIENSNNDAATSLVLQAGSISGMNRFFQQIGATHSVMGSHWGLTQTTALDQLKVVNEVAYPTLLHSGSVQAADQLLDNVESDQRWGVSGGVPASVTVRLKNGWLQNDDGSWIVNSIGYVQGKGVDYSIAVYTDADATEQTGITLIESLSTATWHYLSTLKS